ncbi:MAG: FoF1 ATP synthase subunit gamma, partial [Lawsonibacter sp.]
EEHFADVANPTLFLVGQAGRVWFAHRNIRVDGEFMYTAQDPTLARAREICEVCLKLFRDKHLDEVYLLYTRMVNAMVMEPVAIKLLPLERELFPMDRVPADRLSETVKYVPSETAVMDRLVPSYLSGMIFGALVESFCSEQNARMTAMNASSKSARKMLKSLNLTYNRVRQAAITQEITEVVGGAQADDS